MGVALTIQLAVSMRAKAIRRDEGAAFLALAHQIAQVIPNGSRIVVRSEEGSTVDPFWGGGPNNYEDPRVFYATHSRGWIFPMDKAGSAALAEAQRDGAEYYVELQTRVDDELSSWLEKHARVVLSSGSARVYALRTK